jgi:ABC-type spermidine/putrescine transport system permease subunit I
MGDPYFYEIFLRTLWISALTTLLCVLIGVPEAYILSRMGTPWRSIFLILILTPLLISVVVRAFGWSLLLGADGLVNQTLQAFGGSPDEAALYAVRGGHCAGSRDAAVHDHSGLDLAAETRCPPPSKPRCRWVPASSR